MFRNRTRRPIAPLDEVTAERLLSGAPVDDLPDEYRALAGLLAAASGRATRSEADGEAAAAAAFVSAYEAAKPPVRRVRTLVAASIVAVLVTLSAGTALAASAGVLPEPAQAAAHDVLGVVGISVPGIGDHPREPDDTRFDEPSATLAPEVTATNPTTGEPATGAVPSSDPLGPSGATDGSDHSSNSSVDPNQPDGTGNGNSAGGQPDNRGRAPSSPPGQDKKDANSRQPDSPPGQDDK